jgi:pimeloyl-ACP methyl ester carboxylesterase
MKRTLYLLNGMMSDHRLWQPQIQAMGDKFDIDAPVFRDCDSLFKMAQQLLQNAPAQFAIIGTSMGGYLALEIMRQSPDRITHLGLFNTNGYADKSERKEVRQTEIDAGQDAFIKHRQNLDNMNVFLSPTAHERDDIKSIMRDQALDLGYDVMVNQQKSCMTRLSSMALLPQITIPTTILGGRHDIVTPPEGQIDLAQGIKNARLVLIPDCGHVATLEKPDHVTHEILNLLNQ